MRNGTALAAPGGPIRPDPRHGRERGADRESHGASEDRVPMCARGIERAAGLVRRSRGRGPGGALVRSAGLLRRGSPGRSSGRGARSRHLWQLGGRQRDRTASRPFLLERRGILLAARAPDGRGWLSLTSISVRRDSVAGPRDSEELDAFGSDRLRRDLVGAPWDGKSGGTRSDRKVLRGSGRGLGPRVAFALGSLAGRDARGPRRLTKP